MERLSAKVESDESPRKPTPLPDWEVIEEVEKKLLERFDQKSKTYQRGHVKYLSLEDFPDIEQEKVLVAIDTLLRRNERDLKEWEFFPHKVVEIGNRIAYLKSSKELFARKVP